MSSAPILSCSPFVLARRAVGAQPSSYCFPRRFPSSHCLFSYFLCLIPDSFCHVAGSTQLVASVPVLSSSPSVVPSKCSVVPSQRSAYQRVAPAVRPVRGLLDFPVQPKAHGHPPLPQPSMAPPLPSLGTPAAGARSNGRAAPRLAVGGLPSTAPPPSSPSTDGPPPKRGCLRPGDGPVEAGGRGLKGAKAAASGLFDAYEFDDGKEADERDGNKKAKGKRPPAKGK